MRGARILVLLVALMLADLTPRSGMAQAPASAGPQRQLVVAVAQTKLQLYFDAELFAARMDQPVREAMKGRPDLVVFPEDIGITLVSLGDREALQGCSGRDEATQRLFGKYQRQAEEAMARHKVSPIRALWLVKTPKIKEVYQRTFSQLAAKYKVHIVAGSTPLNLPQKPAEVYNAACLFTPQGQCRVVALKVHPIPLEQAGGLDLSSGDASHMTVFEVAGIRVGVLVCADAWDSKLADDLVGRGAELLVQVSANPEVWSAGSRVGWRDGLYRQIQRLRVYGVSCMGVGQLFDVPFQGQSAIIGPKSLFPDRDGILQEARTATEEEVLMTTLTFPPRK